MLDPNQFTGPHKTLAKAVADLQEEMDALRDRVAALVLAGIDFASDEAAERALGELLAGNLDPAQIDPTGKHGATVKDVERAMEAEPVTPLRDPEPEDEDEDEDGEGEE